MKLSEKESAIIAAAELRAEAPISVLKRESGCREHVIRYALHRLRQNGLIFPVPFINLHRVGFTVYSVFFSIDVQRRETKDSLLKSLMSAPNVVWIGEFGGEYQYGIALCARDFSSVVDFLKALSRKHRRVFFEKAVSLQISATMFPRKYLSSRKTSSKPVTVTCGKDIVEIDDLDSRILSGLSTWAQLSHRQLALKLQVPLSTLELRIKKLREHGVIAADVFFIDTSKLQMFSFKLLVYAKGVDPDLTNPLFKFCSEHPSITYFIECLGSWGYEIGVEVPVAEEVTSVIQSIYESFGGAINTIKVLTKFRYPKVRWFPEVSALP